MDSVLYTEEFVRRMLVTAYRAGHCGPLELDEQTVDEILAGDVELVFEKTLQPPPGDEAEDEPCFEPPAPARPQRFGQRRNNRPRIQEIADEMVDPGYAAPMDLPVPEVPMPEIDLYPPPGGLPANVQIERNDVVVRNHGDLIAPPEANG